MTSEDRPRATTVRNLVIFTVVVLAIGWLARGLDVLMGAPAREAPGIGIWLVTPTLIGLLLRALAGDGWKDLGIRPNLRGNGAYYLVALVIYPVLTAVVLIIGRGVGLVTFPDLSPAGVGLILQAFAAGLAPQFIKNIFEEAAWRGYLAPRVYSLRLNDFVGHVVVGLIWGAWHIPYYLFFLERTVLSEFTTLDLAAFIPLAMLAMVAWAMVYGEIRLLTNSFWPAVLMHMVEDAFLNQLFTGHHIRIVPGTDWLISPVNGLISILLFAAAGVALHRLRRRRTVAA